MGSDSLGKIRRGGAGTVDPSPGPNRVSMLHSGGLLPPKCNSGCRFSIAGIRPSSAVQLPITVALHAENLTLLVSLYTICQKKAIPCFDIFYAGRRGAPAVSSCPAGLYSFLLLGTARPGSARGQFIFGRAGWRGAPAGNSLPTWFDVQRSWVGGSNGRIVSNRVTPNGVGFREVFVTKCQRRLAAAPKRLPWQGSWQKSKIFD